MFACVQFGRGGVHFALTKLRQEKDELFEIDLMILAVIFHQHVDQPFAQRIDIHFGNAEEIFTCQKATVTFVQGFESAVQAFDLLASETCEQQTEQSADNR